MEIQTGIGRTGNHCIPTLGLANEMPIRAMIGKERLSYSLTLEVVDPTENQLVSQQPKLY
jgi:hypothetical protein